MRRFEQALILIEQALTVWSADWRVYQPEIARSKFLKSKVLEDMGQSCHAQTAAKEAYEIRAIIRDDEDFEEGDGLTESDFDRLVTFWSR